MLRRLPHAPFAAVLIAALLLRFAGLGDIPSPAGDEANWTSWALDFHRGREVSMPPEASFVSLLFAHMLALSFDVLGPSTFAARAVPACASMLMICFVYATIDRLGSRRAALAMASVLAFHPWSVAWSRTVAVPYALALATSVVGGVAVAYGVTRRTHFALGAGIVIVALGAQFSPLTVGAAIGAGTWALRTDARFVLRSPATYAGSVLAMFSVLPRVRAAMHVAHAVQPSIRDVPLGTKLAYFGHMITTELAGEATLRHFGHAALRLDVALILAVPFVGALGYAASRSIRATSPTRGLGAFMLVAALVALPVVLAPARLWYLPDIDRERYLFVLLPGLALLVGDLAAARGRDAAIAGVLVAVLAVATLRLGVDAACGGGVDGGIDVFHGGEAYRGFGVTRDLRSPVRHIADELVSQAPRGSGVVLAEASMRPIGFEALRRIPSRGLVHPPWFFAEAEYYPDPYSHTGDYFFVVWPDAAFARTPATARARATNAALRIRMHRDYADVHLVRRYTRPNGAPSMELWRARRASGARL